MSNLLRCQPSCVGDRTLQSRSFGKYFPHCVLRHRVRDEKGWMCRYDIASISSKVCGPLFSVNEFMCPGNQLSGTHLAESRCVDNDDAFARHRVDPEVRRACCSVIQNTINQSTIICIPRSLRRFLDDPFCSSGPST